MLTRSQAAKFDLLAHGLKLADGVQAYVDAKAGPRPLTLADYASTSGVILELEDDIWVNAPITAFNPNMVLDPRHELRVADGGLALVELSSGKEVAAKLALVPAYHDQQNGRRQPFTDYVHTHADRARISPIRGCAMRCKFCDIPYEYKGSYEPLSVVQLLESAARAFDDPVQPAAHLLISGGTPGKGDYAFLRQVYRSVISAFEGIDVDVMMVPSGDILDLDELVAAGVNELSLNVEIWDEKKAAYVIPEKARLGRRAQLDFIAAAVDRLGRGRVRSILMVGLEAPESTLAGVEALASVGCVPVLSPFRPDPITELKSTPPPSAAVMVEVFNEARDIAAKYGLKLGPRCIPCSHNTLTLADGSADYEYQSHRPATI